MEGWWWNIFYCGMVDVTNGKEAYKVMEKAQAEGRKEFDNKGYVDEADLHQLIYLKCTIRDAMRLHSPVPFFNS